MKEIHNFYICEAEFRWLYVKKEGLDKPALADPEKQKNQIYLLYDLYARFS